MASHRKELKLGSAQRDLVNFSVKAQDQILRAAAEGIVGGSMSMIGGFKTTDDLITLGGPGATTQYPGVSKVLNSLSIGAAGTNFNTNASQEEASKMIAAMNKSGYHGGEDNLLLLPSIKSVRKQQASPFKGNGFLDMPNMMATQKMMRQTVRAAAAERSSNGNNQSQYNPRSPLNETARGSAQSADRIQSVKMNPKVLETWINETLQDAEHLDIPGVILKPEHKNPISRYGIDRLALTNAGIPNELVDRIFRALFVYSVGFYELVKKCLQHTERKYSIITAIWKVFSILLEYCCKTDYRMLISEISKEHKDELDRLEREFQQKFGEQAENERILKQNMEILQKYTEELEKEKNSERQMRLKLEEEYMQNTKNHEEEVQLRLKFESKLNNMHSVHRDLETKYKRALSELAGLQTIIEQLYSKNNNQAEEITSLKTVKAGMESKISYNDEKIAGLQREVGIKVRQVQDLEQKFSTAQDELDLTKYKLQELQKDLTEQKLKIDVFDSQVTGLKNEKQHLLLELKETKDLQKVYEKKCGTLISDINKINLEFQESKRKIIGFGEIQKEREDRIDKLKTELRELKVVHEDLDLKHGTLCIHYDKVKEQYETSKRDLDDAIEKLHITNKVRHETELKLAEESERARALQDVIRDKDEQLHKRAQEIEDMDRRVIELERTNENIEIKKASLERQFEITKKQLSEKIQNLNEVLQSEKETREMWIERYEKEQKEHTQTNANLLHAKSQLKDQILATKNVEIKLQTTQKANEVLTEQNARLQDQLNDALAKQENLERDVNTQKEIMKQMEANRKEYIAKLKSELLTVESRFHQKVEQAEMVSQDFMSRAAMNVREWEIMKGHYEETKGQLEQTLKEKEEKLQEIAEKELVMRRLEMATEDVTSYMTLTLNETLQRLKDENSDNQIKISSLTDQVIEGKEAMEERDKLREESTTLKEELKLQRTEYLTQKKEKEKLQHTIERQTEQLHEMQNELKLQSQRDITSAEAGAHKSVDNRKSQGSIGSQKSGAKPASQGLQAVKTVAFGREMEVQTDLMMTHLQMMQQQRQMGPAPQGYMPQQQMAPQSYMGQHQSHPGQSQMMPQNQMGPPSNQGFIQQPNNPSNQGFVQPNSQQNSQLSNQQQFKTHQTPIGGPQNVQAIINGGMLSGLEIQTSPDFKPTHDTMFSPFNQTQEVMTNGETFQGAQDTLLGSVPMSSLMQSPVNQQQQFYQQIPMGMTTEEAQMAGGIQSSGLSYQEQQQMLQQYMPQQQQYGGEQYQQQQQQQYQDNNIIMMMDPIRTQTRISYQQQQYMEQQQTQMSGGMPSNGQVPSHGQMAMSHMSGGMPYQAQPSQHSGNNNNQMRQVSQGLQHQNSLNGGASINGGSSAHNSSIHQGISRAPSNRMQVDFKNMNTVMQPQPSQASNHSGNSMQQKGNGMDRNPTNLSINPSQNGSTHQQQMQNANGPVLQSAMMIRQNNNGMPGQAQQQQQYNNPGDDYRQQNDAQQMLIESQLSPTSQQQVPSTGNTRLKVDINNSNYGASQDPRRNLASGGAMSVHTPMSQVSGYSQHLVPQSTRFQQHQPPMIVTNPANAGQTLMSQNQAALHGSSVGMANLHSGGPQQQQHQAPLDNKKVTGKSSIRTLIKAAATRE